MTQAGLLVGKALNSGNEKIIGISVARSAEKEVRVLREMIDEYSKKVEVVSINDIVVDNSYLCDGYGTFNQEIQTVIKEQITCNGMPLDPTYTGKAFWGMLNYLQKNRIEDKRILFIHTGGTPLFFDWINKISWNGILY